MIHKTDNFFFKEKLEFLAKEEHKHHALVANMIKNGGSDEVTEDTALRAEMPSLIFSENEPLSRLIEAAMNAERASCKFYQSLSEQVKSSEEKALLRYLSSMEASHYHMLEGKLEALRHIEDYDTFNEMMHEGP